MEDHEATEPIEKFKYRAMAKPWSRYWSRMLDIHLWSWPVTFGVAALFPAQTNALLVYDERGYALFFLSLPLIMVVDAFCLALLGNTPGRAIVGIRVETIRHQRLPVPIALYRNGLVYLKGLGLGIPLVALWTLISSVYNASAGEQTSWDKDLYTRVYDVSSGPVRTFICAILVAISIWAGYA